MVAAFIHSSEESDGGWDVKTTIIYGPPGTGKTSRLLDQLERELERGTDPKRIAFVSFTTAAVNEATSRAHKRFQIQKRDTPYFKTLHALAFSALGLSRGSVMDDYFEFGKEYSLRLATEPRVGKDAELLRAYQLCEALRAPFADVARQWKLPVSEERYDGFMKKLSAYKSDHAQIDYSDMLDQFLKEGASINVDVAFIDEAQDLTPQQWAVVSQAFASVARLYVAGDDDQAIYHWAGADVSKLLELRGDKVVLGNSFRLPRSVKRVADSISARIRVRQSKDWSAADRVGLYRCGLALASIDVDPARGSWMLLARNSYSLSMYVDRIEALGIPYRLSGREALRTGEVESYLAMCALRRGEAVKGDAAKRMLLRGEWSGERAKFSIGEKVTRAKLDARALEDEHALLKNIPPARLRFMRRIEARGDWSCRVDISTIHHAKGSEADHVVLCPDVSRATNSGLATDAEHRVWYVASSRARESLWILKKSAEFSYNVPVGAT